MKKFETQIVINTVQFNVNGTYTPGRKAPNAYSHDDPLFSDAGETPQIEDIEIYIADQEVSEIITDEIKSKIYEEVIEELD